MYGGGQGAPRVHPQHLRTQWELGHSPKAVAVPQGAGTSQCHPAHWQGLTDTSCPGRSEQSPVIYCHKTSQTSPLLLRWLWRLHQPVLLLETQRLSLNSAVFDSFWEQAAMLLLVTSIVVFLLVTGLQTGRITILLRFRHYLLFRQCANISKYWEQSSKCQMEVEGDPHQGQGCNVYLCKLPKFKYVSWSTSLCLGNLQSIEQLKIGEHQKLLRATSLTLGFCFVLCEVWPNHCPSLGHLGMPGDSNEGRIFWQNLSWVTLSFLTWILEKRNDVWSDCKPVDNTFSNLNRVSPSGKLKTCRSLQHVYSVCSDLNMS